MVNHQAHKIPKKKAKPLTPRPVFTKTKLQVLVARGQTSGGAIYNAV